MSQLNSPPRSVTSDEPVTERESAICSMDAGNSDLSDGAANSPNQLDSDKDEALHRARVGIDAIRNGKMVVVMDDLERENEGDLVMAAEYATQKDVAFMVRHSGGILCIPCEAERLHELKLSSMVQNNRDPNNTAFTISVDYRIGTTTGISASDRAKTFKAFADPTAKAKDFTSPGHVFPLIYTPGGVLVRQGHTEASVDLCKLAGKFPAAVITEMINDDGEPKRLQDCKQFCLDFNIPLLCVADIQKYITYYSTHPTKDNEIGCQAASAITCRAAASRKLRGHETAFKSSCRISLKRGDTELKDVQMQVWKSLRTGAEHIVVVKGDVEDQEKVLVRMHSECATGDLLGSTRCDCGPQLTQAYRQLASADRGLLIYVTGHEGRGIGLIEKMKAYKAQDDHELNTYDANLYLGHDVDLRSYAQSVEILKAMRVKSVRLMTNNPDKVAFLARHLPTEMENHITKPGPDSHSYMLGKQQNGKHKFNFASAEESLKLGREVNPGSRPYRAKAVANDVETTPNAKPLAEEKVPAVFLF